MKAVKLSALLLMACVDIVPIVAPVEPDPPPPPPPVYPIHFEWDDEGMKAAWGDMADSVAKAWGEALGYTPADNPPWPYWGRQDLPSGTTIRVTDGGGLWGTGSGWGMIEGGPDRYGIISLGGGGPNCSSTLPGTPEWDGRYETCYAYSVFLHEVGHVFNTNWPSRSWCREPQGWTDEIAECTAGTIPLNTAPKAVERFKVALAEAGLEWQAGDGVPFTFFTGPHPLPWCSGVDVMYSALVGGGGVGLSIPWITPMLLDMLGPNYRPNYERATWFDKEDGNAYRLSVSPRCVSEIQPRG